MGKEILKRALKKDKFPELKIVDCHCHQGPWFNFYFPEAGIGEMIQDADIFGIDKLCVAPHASFSCDFKLGNRQVFDSILKYPDRVFGLLAINGNKPGEIREEFDRYYGILQFVGLKIHPSVHKYSISGENYFVAFEEVKKRGGYVLTHTWDDCPYASNDLCEAAIRAFPDVPFILAHAGGISIGVDKAIKLVNKYENAFIDTSGFEFSDTWIEDIISRIDNTKVFFGSDMPFHDLRSGISRVLLADLDDDIKESILGGNFRKMLGINPKKPVD